MDYITSGDYGKYQPIFSRRNINLLVLVLEDTKNEIYQLYVRASTKDVTSEELCDRLILNLPTVYLKKIYLINGLYIHIF